MMKYLLFLFLFIALPIYAQIKDPAGQRAADWDAHQTEQEQEEDTWVDEGEDEVIFKRGEGSGDIEDPDEWEKQFEEN